MNVEMPSHVILVTGSRTWLDESRVRRAFNNAFDAWGHETITSPLLISGHCPTGADTVAERIWMERGLPTETMPADWSTGRGAGFTRNARMVDRAAQLEMAGAVVRRIVFLDWCRNATCLAQLRDRAMKADLVADIRGHFSHGAMHTLTLAIKARLDTVTVRSDAVLRLRGEPPS